MRFALAVLVAVSGCSLVGTSSPRPLRRGELPSCSTSEVAPALDVTQALGYGTVAIAGLSSNDQSEEAAMGAAFAVVGLILGAAHAASAVHGFSNTRQCRYQHARITRMWIEPESRYNPSTSAASRAR